MMTAFFLILSFNYLFFKLYSKVLSDQDKRRTYDQHGEEGVKKMGGFGDDGGFDPFSSLVQHLLPLYCYAECFNE